MSEKIDITNDDVKTLEVIADKFSKNVIRNHKGNAEAAFMKHLSAGEASKIMTAKLTLAFNAASAERQAGNIARYCSSVVPTMKKAFGEEFMVKAMPEESKNERVIQICKQLGANDLADLCKKAMTL
ncbi:MAG: hypothetical protein H6867_10405 [Rhodospirillales bacterium]|nr:hypothetical protein [Rhodospirillales bacterium]MCB9995805.1 hypothetical protein [Rhodospirillales bacterium]